MRYKILAVPFACILFVLASTKSVRTRGNVVEEDEIVRQLFVWRVINHHQGKLPTCAHNHTKGNFVSEVCTTLKQADSQTATSSGYQYCDCPDSTPSCSRDIDPEDPYVYAVVDNLHLKTCIPKAHFPLCAVSNKRRRRGVAAKIWYGEELPQRVLLYCRCPRGYVWGRTECTSSGRICFVMGCERR